MAKQTSHWVTIPDETLHTPVSKPHKKADPAQAPVQNKLFWGMGFVVLVLFSSALLAPKQFASILQGNLFDSGGFQVVPDDQTALVVNPNGDQLPVETVSDAPKEIVVPEPTATENNQVVEAETDAIAIQIEPIKTQETTEPVVNEPADTVANETPVDTGIQNELDANQKLLQELAQQVQDIKMEADTKDQLIQELMDKATTPVDLKPSATEIPVVNTPVVATTTLGQQPSAIGYRFNTHVVSETPQMVLARNTAKLASQPTVSIDESQQQIYSSQLSNAQGTPESGPKEAVMIAFMLTFAALLTWKMRKMTA